MVEVLAIIGAVAVGYILLLPLRYLISFYMMSDYGFWDTTKWSWRDGLWLSYLEALIYMALLWILVDIGLS